jgi:ribonuclease HI
LDLIYSTAAKHPTTTPIPPTILIINSTIPEIFEQNESTNKLLQIANTNQLLSQLTFYTDGSVIDINTNQCTMGIGWVQIDNNNQILHSFSARVQLWPSSYKTELLSIISAISTVSRNSTVEIFTDSQSVIDKYYKLTSTPYNSNKISKFNTWPLWHTLLNIIKSYNLQINLHKVIAHSNNNFNDQADILAKRHLLLPLLTFKYTNYYNPYHLLQWEQYPVELPTRYFVKNICKAHILATWSSQKRNEEWQYLKNDIDWNSTWLYFNNNQKATSNFTTFKLNTLKSFKTKIFLNELPTYSHFQIIYPNIYTDSDCFNCNKPNSHSHWRFCTNPSLLNNIISTSITQIIQNNTLDLVHSQQNELIYKLLRYLNINSTLSSPDTNLTEFILKGLIIKPLIQTIQNYNISYKDASQLII